MRFNKYKDPVIRILLLIILQLTFSGVLFSQSREILIKAGYIEKFVHFVQWPERIEKESQSGIFIIAVIGDNTMSKTLKEIFSKSDIIKTKISIVDIKKMDEIKDCQMLFISGSEKNNLDQILSFTSGKPILTISDCKGFGEKGVIINMFQEKDYIRYEINRRSLDRSGLIISTLLLNYAVII